MGPHSTTALLKYRLVEVEDYTREALNGVEWGCGG